jgi:hypothetical protein
MVLPTGLPRGQLKAIR